MVRVLVLNSGSSSLKASIVEPGEEVALASVVETGSAQAGAERAATLARALRSLVRAGGDDIRPDAVGHRVVHGGAQFNRAVIIDDGVVQAIDALTDVAPLHNATAVETIRAARAWFPDIPHVACFDTAFHATLPEEAWRYPVPDEWTSEWGVRRFGFHGLSVAWSVRKAAESLGRAPEAMSLVVAHLGSGCSVSAVREGRSMWTSMGLTPLEGLMMGTRAGSIDPGILLFLMRTERLGVAELGDALERRSGLLGASGVSSDLREVRAAADAGNRRASLAVTQFVARAAEGIAAAFTWVRPDALVFTGGIGEHDEQTRGAILERLAIMTHHPDTPAVLVVEAREDLVIADATAELLLTTHKLDQRDAGRER